MEEKGHRLVLEDRRELILSGVVEADSSEDHRVVFKTILGDLIIDGQNLRIKSLDLVHGEATVSGEISALLYNEKRKGRRARLIPFEKNFFRG